MGYLSAVIWVRNTGKTIASHAITMHSDETKANCTRVSVAGLSKAIRIDLEDVLVRAEEVYHMRHRIYVVQRQVSTWLGCVEERVRYGRVGRRTMSLGETGARRASASS